MSGQQQEPMGGELGTKKGAVVLAGWGTFLIHAGARANRNVVGKPTTQGYSIAFDLPSQIVGCVIPLLVIAVGGPNLGDDLAVQLSFVLFWAWFLQGGAALLRRAFGSPLYSYQLSGSWLTLFGVSPWRAQQLDSLILPAVGCGVWASGVSIALARSFWLMGGCHFISLMLLQARDARRSDLIYDEAEMGQYIADRFARKVGDRW